MRISELVAAVVDRPGLRDLSLVLPPDAPAEADVELSRATHDSRAVTAGSLFCCVVGAVHDGHDHAPDAVAAGAAALLVERPLGLGVPELRTGSARAAMGPLAAELAGRPSDRLAVVGVTGTNGKTTTTHLLAAILEAAGRPCGLIGTLTGARTTPEAPELQDRLAQMADEGKAAVAMEVSSHALDLHRVDGTHFRVAVFTNLSRDHLDHHGDMASYFQAKARLFEPDRCELAVLNLDDPHGRLLRDAAEVPSVGYSLDDAEDLVLGPDGSTFTWRGAAVHLDLAGRFNVSNALAAATAAAALGVTPADVARGLATAGTVAGRFERVDVGQPYLAVVDYAHTPDGLEQLLLTARELAGDGRVVLVFGAGGERDHAKRPMMGEVAARLADVVVVTTDNPRGEDPAAIISQVHDGMDDPRDLRIEPDRRQAIRMAVASAEAGDVVLVAGKGHETTQTIGSIVTPFDDREVLREALVAASAGDGR
ncbi:UDP-N-acetylmuramoyl-L-alanyl-D-glutamate--2,6-diaminopimelate ligase [Aquihabitans sp. G128]|uniref:UDP-N-acetylmuramoyl-L-alanyl-D-glutamate--2, 6-diaminopimelate ligase n=1 Tax=Aquihabitans sp. G128 TaxID=2849779 RepID=UPI001C233AE3|nr:UDP-N-acetylmuramoyl-L-alanyl-D-glutamate--2,6-diaminopimelate ligase [Aquihabitans sp. G128]QXC62274.1 UDP-N-acetylmuramoyl-L-alanyl-D-glutamate--2,6-diaminopimelate ligase [Aquihabitans sp. G128]